MKEEWIKLAARWTGTGYEAYPAGRASKVEGARPNAAALLQELRSVGAQGCYLYCVELDLGDRYGARSFNPTVGIWEDRRPEVLRDRSPGILRSAGSYLQARR